MQFRYFPSFAIKKMTMYILPEKMRKQYHSVLSAFVCHEMEKQPFDHQNSLFLILKNNIIGLIPAPQSAYKFRETQQDGFSQNS
jgi:hypothetical protein